MSTESKNLIFICLILRFQVSDQILVQILFLLIYLSSEIN